MEVIEVVIINLIQNAIEAMEDIKAPRLSFVTERNRMDQVQVMISYNGKGIDKEVIEKISLPFYSTKTNNSGIGLSLAQQIMMVHNGGWR
jgi:two-component system, NtrC family, nitrogen regulation sensor histidine kinase NtrY